MTELDLIHGDTGKSDPSVRGLRARVLEAVGRKAEARVEVADPVQVASTFGPWWAIRGRWEREDGEGANADASFVEAVATDPFDVEAACEVDDALPEHVDDSGPETAARALCDAARARHEPPLGRD